MEKPDLPLHPFTLLFITALNILCTHTKNQINVIILALIVKHNLENSKGTSIIFTHILFFLLFFPSRCSKITSYIISVQRTSFSQYFRVGLL